MSETAPISSVTAQGIEIRFPDQKHGLFSRLLSGPRQKPSFTDLDEDHRNMLFAIGDLRNWQDLHEDGVEIATDHLRLSHDAAAHLTSRAAQALGLPEDVHLTLRTDVTGVLGKPDFKLEYEWSQHGRRESPKRTGAILHTAEGDRRIPLWMKQAIDLADQFEASRPMEEHWAALAGFRKALEPEAAVPDALPENRTMAGLSMTAFLRNLEVRIANRFSISPDKTLGHFDIVPYSARNLQENGIDDSDISEADAELSGEALAVFQNGVHERGARPAYRLGNNAYLVVDKSIAPVLEEMARVLKAPREERKAFVANPRAFITEAVNRHLSDQGAFQDLDEAGQQEMVEAVAGPALVESREYSERVTGVTVYEKPPVDFDGSGTAWLPEVFNERIAEIIADMPLDELRALHDHMQASLDAGGTTPARIDETDVPVTPARVAAVKGALERREQEDHEPIKPETEDEETAAGGPVILDTLDNFDDLAWHAKFTPRSTALPFTVPDTITTDLRDHQKDSFRWATQAWSSGLPGILNADEQGLGKTLQTISFLNWLQGHMKDRDALHRGPILIVAPTSLLRNWEEEVDTHVASGKFGRLIRLYGSSLAGQKRHDAQGKETDAGLPLLDLDWLEEAFEDGRAHRYWFLTTYTTLANYQHSLGKIPFSALVMDEIQNIKNRVTLASKAIEAMNADFRIGLTGTPIENSTMDLWTVMDRIAPGSLGDGQSFKTAYSEPDPDNMADLHSQVFGPQGLFPPLGLRRLKDEVARDLPHKTRLLHPRMMPKAQAETYNEAQIKLAEGGPGAALKMLHHIRSVSVHPGGTQDETPEEFVNMSARLIACMDVIRDIRAKGERVLVFIEHRNMQFRFAELMRHFFGLDRIDVINGDTPILKRQQIVNHFQRHLKKDAGFDMLILGPKAAGTGLTLTAATHVIHLSRWWNPAVEEQCNDRVHRIGQTKPVEVHVPMAIHPEYGANSFDCLLQSLMQRKRRMATQALWPMGTDIADLSALQSDKPLDRAKGALASVEDSIFTLFERDGVPRPQPKSNGAYPF